MRYRPSVDRLVKLRRSGRTGFVLTALVCVGCSPTYVLRAGWEEARILSARRPIRAIVHDTAVTKLTRDKLRLVLDVRDFAEHELGLRAGRSYETFAQLDRDTLALNVLAAPEFELNWKTWWFPIVGHVPYKGHFNFQAAFSEARKLEAEGYDVVVQPVSAFSTLGWFPDPIMSTTLRLDSLALVDTIIHEITHSTFFLTGQADFNESFATFVGNRGAIAFFCDAVQDPITCGRARRRWEDTRRFGRFFHSVLEPLTAVYESDLSDDEKRRDKRAVFVDAARRFYDDHELSGRYSGRRLDADMLNNAWMISRLLYYTRLDEFERVYQSQENIFKTLQVLIQDAASLGDPWEALDRLGRTENRSVSLLRVPGPPVTSYWMRCSMTDVI